MLKAQSQTKKTASESYKVTKRKKRRRSRSLNRTQILSRVLQVDVWESPDSLKEFPFVFALVLFCCQVKYSIFRYALEEAAVAVDLLFILDQLWNWVLWAPVKKKKKKQQQQQQQQKKKKKKKTTSMHHKSVNSSCRQLCTGLIHSLDHCASFFFLCVTKDPKWGSAGTHTCSYTRLEMSDHRLQ